MPRQSPWRREFTAPLHVIQGELNRLLEEYWNPSRIAPASSPPIDLEPTSWSPAVDLVETPEATILVAEVPGIDPASIDLSVTGNILTLRGVKPQDDLPEGHNTLRERQSGTFHRQVVLSNEVNFEAAQAEAKNGILRVRLPRQEAAKPRTIPVQHA